MYKTASVYLYPFFLEFTLTSSAMLVEFWRSAKESHENLNHSTDSHKDSNDSNKRKLKLSFAISVGLIIIGCYGFVIFLLHFLSTNNYSAQIFQYFNICVGTFSTIVCLIGIGGLISSNNTKNSTFGFDEVLLIVSMFGVFGLSISSFSSAVYFLQDQNDSYAPIKLTTSVIWVIQAVCQSCFIAMALHREPKEVKKCGRIFNVGYMAIILLFLNFGMCLLDTIDLEGHYRSLYSESSLKKLNQLENNLFGQTTWTWIMLVFYPLAIFFRIHSVSTLYHVFKHHKYLPMEPKPARGTV
ncbi:uncharacterized protein LOC134188154 [Corticium candelabrum]|uniref:uncharacterized protein LOC134188154 n=1 Tax=Corticium candelabrum TaxID=121492 RepID=UPI002E25EFE5|nr:uncharacterized protein LOC134188154 [Corticium candelabrum]